LGFGWAESILKLDLTHKKIVKEPTAKYANEFIGGRGINVKILYENVNPKISPFDPDNLLIFGVGPLVGASPLCACRTEVTTKSPQMVTSFLGETNFGGHFGSELKFAGFDHIVIKGRSDRPIYLWINDGQVEIKDASELWGKNTVETQTIIKEELGDENIQVACIGPAGENLVTFANILHGIGHAAGRLGAGAVMGSKKIKAIAVRGTNPIDIANPKKLIEECETLYNLIKSAPNYKELSTYGWSTELGGMFKAGFAIVGNWELGYWEPMDKYGRGEYLVDKYARKSVGCQGCPVHCMHVFEIPNVGYGMSKCLSYVSFTSNLWNYDLEFLFKLSLLGNEYGLDWNSLPVIIGWLMELYARGIINEKDTDGIALKRGDKDAILTIIQKIIKREGIGDILAQGITPAAKKIGRGSEKYAVQIKGIDPQPLEFRVVHAYALAAAVGRPDGIRANPVLETSVWGLGVKDSEKISKEIFGTEKAIIPWEYEGKAAMVRYYENSIAAVDSLSFCKHVIPCHFTISLKIPANLFQAITGKNMTEHTLLQVGEKIRALERAFEAREGVTRKDDVLPDRFFNEPVHGGVAEGRILDREKFEKMKDEYYALRGWDIKTGNPTRKRLEELGLKDVANDLEKWRKLPE
jgi:aldehyde:ferredoxin oxidoreductase